MALSPRLLRPRASGSGLHPEAFDWISRVTANGGTASTNTLAAVSTFCAAIDAAGIRDRFYRLNLLCGNNLTAMLVPLYRTTSFGGSLIGSSTEANNGPFVSADYAESTGLTIASGKSLWSGLATNAYAAFATPHIALSMATSAGGFAVFSTSAVGDANRFYAYHSDISGGYRAFNVGIGQTTGELSYQLSGAARLTGRLIASRTSSSRIDIYNNGVGVASSTASVTAPTGGTNNIGISNGGYSGTMRYYSFGDAMTSTQAAAYDAALASFLTTIGRA